MRKDRHCDVRERMLYLGFRADHVRARRSTTPFVFWPAPFSAAFAWFSKCTEPYVRAAGPDAHLMERFLAGRFRDPLASATSDRCVPRFLTLLLQMAFFIAVALSGHGMFSKGGGGWRSVAWLSASIKATFFYWRFLHSFCVLFRVSCAGSGCRCPRFMSLSVPAGRAESRTPCVLSSSRVPSHRRFDHHSGRTAGDGRLGRRSFLRC